MKPESLVLGIAGICFGLIVGWVLGSQQAVRSTATPPAQETPAASTTQTSQPPPIDESRVKELEERAQREPKNADVRAQLGNLYFDGERCQQAIPWYEASLKLDPRNVDVSTGLGICYYQTNEPDKALSQFDHSLKVEPRHVKTLLNVGIVRAFSKQDFEGATKAWKQVVELAPGSQEAALAQRGLEGIASTHPNLNGSAQSSGSNR